MYPNRAFSFILAAAAVSILLVTPAARADNSSPAIVAFDAAWATTNDYTCTLHSHEALGTKTQDRVYQYSFMKPHFAKTLIVSGDGEGSGGTWSGGDTVSGHQGGFLSRFHLNVSIHDPRATSLRGFTIPDGLLPNIVSNYVKIAGTLTQTDGGKIGGVLTDRVELKVANPANNGGISDQVIYFSRETHFPVRQILYTGSQVVLDQSITDLKTNVGLKESDF